jgi:hypothetical protein
MEEIQMSYNNNIEREMGWDDTFERDSVFTLLPAGDYDFTITAFERGRHNGSDKLPPCSKATISIEITNGIEKSTISHKLFLHSRTEGMVCEFFTAIGMRRPGEPLVPNWNAMVGMTGRCKVGIRTYNGNEYNEVKRFYDPVEKSAAQAPEAPRAYQAGTF